MTKNRTMVYLVSAALVLVVVCLLGMQLRDVPLPLFAEVTSVSGTERLNLWQADTDEVYLFLPAYAEPEKVKLYSTGENQVQIDGVPLAEIGNCAKLAANEPHTITYRIWGQQKAQNLYIFRSANLSTMYLNTQSGNMKYIHADKGNAESGNIAIYQADGTLEYSGAIEEVNGRGNDTWVSFEKKSYSFCLTHEADLLDMGSAQKWVLLANADDPSHMRNKLICDFANRVGLSYSPESAWVDLYLNGEYAGLYLLSERNEIHQERVNISKQGSFLVSMENGNRLIRQNYPYISTQSGKYLRIHQDYTTGGISELRDYWQSVENAIMADDGVDPESGKTLDMLIDLDSWANKYLIEEVFGNIDAGNHSQFFYLDGSDPNGKIISGPTWDYDHSWGNTAKWQLVAPNGLFAERPLVEEGFAPSWYYGLYCNENFQKNLKQQYSQIYLPELAQLLETEIAEYVYRIEAAARCNGYRWNTEPFDNQAWYLQDYLQQRISFLNRIWLAEEPYHTVRISNNHAGYYGYYGVFDGEALTSLPAFQNTANAEFLGWFDETTDEPFDITQPITEDIEIYAKWKDTAPKGIDKYLKQFPLIGFALLGAVLIWIERGRIKKRG